MYRKWNHGNCWGKKVPNLCEPSLTKANLWKIQKPRCDVFYFVNVSLLVCEIFNVKDALGTCHGDVEYSFMCHLTLVDFVCIDMSSRVLVIVAFYHKTNYLANE